MPDEEVYGALLEANTKLIRNYFIKKGDQNLKAGVMIDNFRRLYFPQCPEDLKFRGARKYTRKV